MGLYVKGVLGSFSGKVGTVVGANWRSIDYMRSLPKPSNKPATEKQVAHRAKFAMVINFLSPLRELINVGFNDSAQTKQTGFNRATGHLMSVVEGEFPDYTIPYGKVILGTGSLQPIRARVESDLDGLALSWTFTEGTINAQPDDVVNIVLYDSETDDFFVYQDALREDGTYSIPFDELNSESLHTWVFASSADGTKSSKSIYMGTLSV